MCQETADLAERKVPSVQDLPDLPKYVKVAATRRGKRRKNRSVLKTELTAGGGGPSATIATRPSGRGSPASASPPRASGDSGSHSSTPRQPAQHRSRHPRHRQRSDHGDVHHRHWSTAARSGPIGRSPGLRRDRCGVRVSPRCSPWRAISGSATDWTHPRPDLVWAGLRRAATLSSSGFVRLSTQFASR